jgi:hypothetical protein
MMYRRTLLIQSVHRAHQLVEQAGGEGAVDSAKHCERRASRIGGCDINAVCQNISCDKVRARLPSVVLVLVFPSITVSDGPLPFCT